MPSMFILRRNISGIGGAQLAAYRFKSAFAVDWDVELLSAGVEHSGQAVSGAAGPGWLRALCYCRSVERLVRKEKPDLVFNMERGPIGDVYRVGDGIHRRWLELRYGRSPVWMSSPWHWLAPRLEARSIRAARIIVANSQMVHGHIKRFYPKQAGKVRVIYNGFDPIRFRTTDEPKALLRRQLELPENGKMLLFCGIGWERKGLSDAIRMTAMLNQRVAPGEPRGFLCVLGSGDPRPYRREARRLGLEECIRFPKPVVEVRPYYQAADVMVLPSYFDPFSNACLEALACGCPVITTEGNGISEVIRHGRTGFVMDIKRHELHAAVDWSAKVRVSPREVADSVAHLHLENEIAQYSRLFEELLETTR